MRLTLLMVRKDLLRQVRSPMGILFALSFPVVFATLIALAFGTGAQPKFPKVQLLVEDLDDSFLSAALVSATTNDQVAEYFEVRPVGPEGRELLGRGEASALWRIPKGFQAAVLDGTPVRLELIRNPAQSIFPEIAEQGLTVLAEVLSSAARALRDPLDRLRPMVGVDAVWTPVISSRLTWRSPFESVAMTWKHDVPTAFGVPSMEPSLFKLSPGKPWQLSVASDHVIDPVPPMAVRDTEYGRPATPSGSGLAVVIVGGRSVG